jgi:ribonucleoside-diphosphate reductase alpha chain
MTIFRDGCARMGVLTLEPKKEEVKQNKVERAKSQLNFGDTILVDDSVIGIKRKLKTGCGSLHCTFYFCPETGELREVFLDKGSSGGCLSLLNAMSRLSSLAARKGAPVEEIADQLQSVLVCPSYSIAKFKDPKTTSKGSSCASAVANALLDAHKQFVEEFLEIEEDEEIEFKTVQKDLEPEDKEGLGLLVCPECGAKALAKTEGCMTCHSCGWSRCS